MSKPRAGLALVPAAARGSQKLSRVAPPAPVVSSVERFEKQLGGRAQLLEVLAIGEALPEVQAVLYGLSDPTFDALPLAEVCAAHNITPSEFFTAVNAAYEFRGQILAQITNSKALPEVMAAVVATAIPHQVPCDWCEGVGTYVPKKTKAEPNPSPLPCKPCRGSGTVTIAGSLDHQKLVLEMGKLLTKGAGITLNQQNLTTQINPAGGGVAGGALERLQQAVASVLNETPGGASSTPSLEVIDVSATTPASPAANPESPSPPPAVSSSDAPDVSVG